jgi:protein gp37
MADVFEGRRDLDTSRARLWQLIEATPYLDWLLLTKRPQFVGELVPWGNRWPDNVWLGTTVENQRWAERRIPHLLHHPAAVRFLSCEPLLGPLNLSGWLAPSGSGVNWVIAGGESGARARPMNPDWALKIRDDCEKAGVGFHFKQWGNWRPTANDHVNGHDARRLRRESGESVVVLKVGKKAAGRVLDGREWDGLPAAGGIPLAG